MIVARGLGRGRAGSPIVTAGLGLTARPTPPQDGHGGTEVFGGDPARQVRRKSRRRDDDEVLVMLLL